MYMQHREFQPAAVGHNSRAADFKRVTDELSRNLASAAEIRARTLKQRIKPDMPFFLQWPWELFCSDATSSQKLTGIALYLFGDSDGSNAGASIRTLSALTGLAKDTVSSALVELEKHGFATDKKEGSGTRPDRYKLAIPAKTIDELAAGLENASDPSARTQSLVTPELGHNDSDPSARTQGSRNKIASVLVESRSDPSARTNLLTLEEEDKSTARANGCELFGLQAGDAASQPGWKKRFAHVDWRWGYSPDAKPKREPNYAQAQKFLNFANDHRAEFSDRTVNRALEFILGNMETDVQNEPNEKSKPGTALKYFKVAFYDKLRELRQQELEDRTKAATTQKLAEIDIQDREKVKEMGRGAIAKRIEAAAHVSKANGAQPAPAQSDRFPESEKKVADVRGTWIDGPTANMVFDEIEGATVKMVREALLRASGVFSEENPDALSVVKWCAMTCAIQIHGKPDNETRIGGPVAILEIKNYGRTEKRTLVSSLVCFSQPFIDRIKTTYPLLSNQDLSDIFTYTIDSLGGARQPKIKAAAYATLHARVEREFEEVSQKFHAKKPEGKTWEHYWADRDYPLRRDDIKETYRPAPRSNFKNGVFVGKGL